MLEGSRCSGKCLYHVVWTMGLIPEGHLLWIWFCAVKQTTSWTPDWVVGGSGKGQIQTALQIFESGGGIETTI